MEPGPEPTLRTDDATTLLISGDATSLVVLDRVEPDGAQPPYCVHGRATCMGSCGGWVWLGNETYKVVTSGQALPMCRDCAGRLLPPDVEATHRVTDHLRADGPHPG